MLTLFDHPLSPYAQKVKIALLEKGIGFEALLPDNLGAGGAGGRFAAANPRAEVPVLLDGDEAIFDSTIILEYIEDRWPEPPLRPADAAGRARALTVEEVMDTHFEAITWGLSELRYFRRLTGSRAEAVQRRAAADVNAWYHWLERQLGGRPYLVGQTFGWADLCVIPFVNGARGFGLAPDPAGALHAWMQRVNERRSVAQVAAAATDFLGRGAGGGGMDAVADLLERGLFKREYRDHRLEWMVRMGALDVVEQGLAKGNIRFTEPFA